MSKNQEKKLIKQGKDPDSLECIFATVKENLEKVMRLIEKGTKKWGIDLSEIDDLDTSHHQNQKNFLSTVLLKNFQKD